MAGYLRDIEPDQVLARVLRKADEACDPRWTSDHHFTAQGNEGWSDPGRVVSVVKEAIRRDLGVEPLLMVAVGTGYDTIVIHTDPRAFGDRVAPSQTAWRQWFFHVSEGRKRQGSPVSLSDSRLRAKYATREQWQQLGEFCRKFLQSQFGDYIPEVLINGRPTSFFSPKFGGGRLVIAYRLFPGAPDPSDRFPGGYVLIMRDAEIAREALLRGSAASGRAWRREAVVSEPAFRETPESLDYVHPAPPALFPVFEHGNASPTFLHLIVSVPYNQLIPSLLAWKIPGIVLAVLWLHFGWIFLRRLHDGTLRLNVRIAGQLRFGLLLMVGLSLVALLLFARSYGSLVEQSEQWQRKAYFERQLDLLESRAHQRLNSQVRNVWEAKNDWNFSPDSSQAEVERFLDHLLELGDGESAHLISAKNEWIRFRKDSETPFPSLVLKRLADTQRILALHQLLRNHDICLRHGLPSIAPSADFWGKDL
ncbi:MAG TPA: hypothetical protein PKO06_04635, partial [Candidatus Ozemobacteraceae bacterium]|nr:hypothetical protein [Candidatus Ozemobacteraceae bacterium]